MITSALFVFGYVVLQLLIGLSVVVNFAIPNGVADSIEFFVSYLGVLEPFFPVSVLLTAVGNFVTFLAVWYTFKLFVYFVKFIPFIGAGIGLIPKLSKGVQPSNVNPVRHMTEPKIRPTLNWRKDKDGLWRIK